MKKLDGVVQNVAALSVFIEGIVISAGIRKWIFDNNIKFEIFVFLYSFFQYRRLKNILYYIG